MITGLDHVQVAIPTGTESAARQFYGDVLGMEENPKPPALARRGGCWFTSGALYFTWESKSPSLPPRRPTQPSW